MFNAHNITINPKLLPFKGPNFKIRVICANMHATRFTFNLLLWHFGTLCLSHKEGVLASVLDVQSLFFQTSC